MANDKLENRPILELAPSKRNRKCVHCGTPYAKWSCCEMAWCNLCIEVVHGDKHVIKPQHRTKNPNIKIWGEISLWEKRPDWDVPGPVHSDICMRYMELDEPRLGEGKTMREFLHNLLDEWINNNTLSPKEDWTNSFWLKISEHTD